MSALHDDAAAGDDVVRAERCEQTLQLRRRRRVAEPAAHFGERAHRADPAEVVGQVPEPARGEHVEFATAFHVPVELHVHQRERAAHRGQLGVRVDRACDRGVHAVELSERACPLELRRTVDRERAPRLDPLADRQRLFREGGGLVEAAGELGARRLMQRRPLEVERLAELAREAAAVP